MEITDTKARIVVRNGLHYQVLNVNDIAFFYTSNKINYAFCSRTGKHICDKNLAALETKLDKKTFFRVNRQYLVNINFIKSYKTINRVNLQLFITLPGTEVHQIIISQEQSTPFKKWLTGS